jgi:DNA-binding NtrC family response regulator
VTQYDIILGDLCMPDMDGLSLLKQCKVMRPETPFVFLTGHGDPNIEQEVRKAGAYALLHKPIDAAVLLAVVGRAILASPLQTRTTDASVTLTHNPTVGEPGCHWHLQVLKKLNVRNELLRSKIQTLAELHQRDSSSP